MELWDWLPFVLFGGVTILGIIAFRMMQSSWATNIIAPTLLAAVVMIVARPLPVAGAGGELTVVDTIEATIIVVVLLATFIHYLVMSLRNNPRRKIFPCWRREEDAIAPIYPEAETRDVNL